jgi:hypothetical protein
MGNKDFMMNHDDKHPDEVHISPMTDDFLKSTKTKEIGKIYIFQTIRPFKHLA